MIKTVLLSIIYLSYLSKGLSEVKDKSTTKKKKINVNFLLEDTDSLKISVHYRSPLHNDWNYAK